MLGLHCFVHCRTIRRVPEAQVDWEGDSRSPKNKGHPNIYCPFPTRQCVSDLSKWFRLNRDPIH